MSKFSVSEKKAASLEEGLLENLQVAVEDKDLLNEEEIAALGAEMFEVVPYDEEESERTGYSNYSYWGSTLRMFLKNKTAMAMLLILALMLAFTYIQPLLPNQADPTWCHLDENGMPLADIQPNSQFWFGTNGIGQDIWSNMWEGTRNSLFIGFSVACINAVIGIIVGMIWGYVRQLDFILTEAYNVLSNIPSTIILILATYVMSPSVSSLIIAMCVTGWMGMARFIRNLTLMIRDRDFNLASRCLGTPTYRVIMKNLLPQMVSVIMLRLSLAIPGAIGSEAFMAYIGLGLPPTIPSLGSLANAGRAYMMLPSMRYQLIIPCIFLSIITICFYIVGNAFADASDPRNHV